MSNITQSTTTAPVGRSNVNAASTERQTIHYRVKPEPYQGSDYVSTQLEPQLELVYVNASLAADFLSKNQANRLLRPKVVSEYAAIMASGQWHDGGGDPILVTTDGTVIGGQHRLHAIIEATNKLGVPVTIGLTVLWNASPAQRNQPQLKWTPSHSLEAAGFKGVAGLAGGINTYLRLTGARPWTRTSAPAQVIEDFASTNPAKTEAARVFAQFHNKARLLPFSALFAFYYALAERQENLAQVEAFINALNEGTGLTSDMPVYRLREYLMRISRVAQLEPYMIMALLIKTWNAYKYGRTIKALSFREGETFPAFL
jgi:hypothetical protein